MPRLFLVAYLTLANVVFAQAPQAAVKRESSVTGATDAVVVDRGTEQVIQGALRWLAAQQQSNGSWGVGDGRRGDHPVAMTGYVLMAYMTCGHLPEEGEYARTVRAGM